MARKTDPTDPNDRQGLTVRQALAAELTGSGKTDGEAAEIVGIDPTTISKWRHNLPGWAEAEADAERRYLAAARRRLKGIVGRAIDTVADVMDGTTEDEDGNVRFKADPQHRLAAAKTILDRAGVVETKGVELTGASGGPVRIESVDASKLPDADLEALAAETLPGDP